MMRAIRLVAAHEFLETVKSKTFLVFLVAVPVFLGIGMLAPQWLERQTATTRAITVIDAAGGYAADFERSLQRSYARRAMTAVNTHVQTYAHAEFRTPRGLDPDAVPRILLKGESDFTAAEADRFIENGGLQWYLTIAQPFLKPNAPPPSVAPPRAKVVSVPDLPAAETVLAAPSETLAPWLTGEKPLSRDGVSETLQAAVVFPPGVAPAGPDSLEALERGTPETSVQIWSDGALPDGLESVVTEAMKRLFRERALVEAAGDSKILEAADAQAPVLKLDISTREGRELTTADRVERILPRLLSAILIYFLFINMNMLMSNTMEEKSNRIIEVLVSSITPGQLMVGKLLGSSLVALGMFAFVLGSILVILFSVGGSEFVEVASILIEIFLDSAILPALLAYFVLGYFLFAGIFLTLGAFCENNQDVQNLMMPIALFMIVIVGIVWVYAEEPNAPAATVLSFTPFFGPFMLMARTAAEPPMLEVAGGIAVQLLTIAALLWASGKVFRVAVLASGRPPGPRQLYRMFRRAG